MGLLGAVNEIIHTKSSIVPRHSSVTDKHSVSPQAGSVVAKDAGAKKLHDLPGNTASEEQGHAESPT